MAAHPWGTMAEERARQGQDGSVTIIGAGMAGMTAALRLVQAGFDVTVFEASETIGGKFGAIKVGETYHEHAYHFLADWCLNFWSVVRDIGLSKSEHFVRRDAIKFLRPRKRHHVEGHYEFHELKHGGSILNFWSNVHSGVIPPDDMIAYFYSLLDLVTSPNDDPDELEFLNRISVNGFMRSRPYMTDLAALLHQEALLKAFAVPSYDTSVRSYRTFLRYFGRDSGGWILKGDCQTAFWDPFYRALRSYTRPDGRPRFELVCGTPLERVVVEGNAADSDCGYVTEITLRGRQPERPRHLLLAIPYEHVAELLRDNQFVQQQLPDMLDLNKLSSRQMASLDLYFRKPLPGIPAEHVTLLDDSNWDKRMELAYDGDIASRWALSFVDNYQAWNGRTPPEETWLNVVAADFHPLRELDDDDAQACIIAELHRFIDFDDADIDRERSHFRSNEDAPLFANTVGSWQFRPETRTDTAELRKRSVHERVSNLYLAGDYCRSKIDLVCLEGAVTTGIAAARAIAGDGVKPPVVPPEVSRQEGVEAKAALAPWLALSAKGRLRA